MRFDGLIRADNVAEAHVKDKAPVEIEKVSESKHVPEAEHDPLEGLFSDSPAESPLPPPAALPDDLESYSPSEGEAGEPSSGHVSVGGMLAQPTKVRTLPDQRFIERGHPLRRSGKFAALPGKKQLIECCCDDDNEIGLAAACHGVDCLRLTESTLDLSEPQHIEQVIGQLKPGAPGHLACPAHAFALGNILTSIVMVQNTWQNQRNVKSILTVCCASPFRSQPAL